MTDANDIDPKAITFDLLPEEWEQLTEMIRWGIKAWGWGVVRLLLPLIDGDGRRILLVDLTRPKPRLRFLKIVRDSSLWEIAKNQRLLYLKAFAPTISFSPGPSSETD